ncbi:melanoma-associated antigen 10-like [Rhinolophus sinicus]|uniref:melanoma-associated antigen 10-like n=1 Tax=Rhinolophus sinicus TaxID=89399 RepID=UPI003D793823
MPVNQMNELGNLGEDYQDPTETQDLLEEQPFGAEGEEYPSPSSSSSPSHSVLFPHSPVAAAVAGSLPHSSQGACGSASAMEAIPWSQSDDEGSSSQGEEKPSASEVPGGASYSPRSTRPFSMKKLLTYLLLKYRAKEPTTQAEMLSIIREHEDRFPEFLKQASLWLQLLFGIDVKEVDASNHSYVMVTTLGLSYDGMGSDRCCMPKTSLLVMLLCVIAVEGERAPEERVWEALNDMGVYDGVEHSIYGEPRELITKVLVQEQYVEYRQVANTEPARYEFLWGPRAHAETTKVKVLQFLFRVSSMDTRPIPFQSEEGESDEEERA